jgi:hypothetical protein
MPSIETITTHLLPLTWVVDLYAGDIATWEERVNPLASGTLPPSTEVIEIGSLHEITTQNRPE